MPDDTSRKGSARAGKPPDAPANYEVGYGRTPVRTRFQPGQSGNPRGRRKGTKTIGKVLAEALARRMAVQTKNGEERKMRMQDIIIEGLVNDAARRDPRALKLLFMLMDRHGEGHETEIDTTALQPDDLAIIETFLASSRAQEASNVRRVRKVRGTTGIFSRACVLATGT
jgi:hypothetical protein